MLLGQGARPRRSVTLNRRNSIELDETELADGLLQLKRPGYAACEELQEADNDENPEGTGTANNFERTVPARSAKSENDTVVQELVLRVQTELGLQKVESPFFDSSLNGSGPSTFGSSEVEIDDCLLGEGEFCKIYKVTGFNVTESRHTSTNYDDREVDHDDKVKGVAGFVTRGFMKNHCLRDGEARYAIKRIRNTLVGDDIVDAAIDLGREGEFLSNLSHPNIIKIRGTVTEPGNPKFALLLDRLHETVETRMERWRQDVKKNTGKFMGVVGKNKQIIKKIWHERLTAGYDLANAVSYMHSRNILHRDLKLANVGFDIRGDLKVFDLGLAKELKPRDLEGDDEYHTSEVAGTRRYMAPEVIKILPHGKSSDVFSFSICFFEMMSFKKAFANYSPQEHYKNVVSKGKRPQLPKSWPTATKDLIQRCWHQAPHQRPSFQEVCEAINQEVPENVCSNRSNDLMLRSERSACRNDDPVARGPSACED